MGRKVKFQSETAFHDTGQWTFCYVLKIIWPIVLIIFTFCGHVIVLFTTSFILKFAITHF